MALYCFFEYVGLLLMFSTFWEHFERRNCVKYLLLEVLNTIVCYGKFSFKSSRHYFLHLGRNCKCGFECHAEWHKFSFKLCETLLTFAILCLYLKYFSYCIFWSWFLLPCLLTEPPHLPNYSVWVELNFLGSVNHADIFSSALGPCYPFVESNQSWWKLSALFRRFYGASLVKKSFRCNPFLTLKIWFTDRGCPVGAFSLPLFVDPV